MINIDQDHWYESRFTGIFTSFGPLDARPYDPDIYTWGASVVPYGMRSSTISIGGAGWTTEGARMACIGEAIERFQAYPSADDQTILSAIKDWPIDEPFIDIDRWILFHPEQYQQPDFPFKPFTNKTVCHWTCLREFNTGLPYWIPEEFAFLFPRITRDMEAEHHLCASISTGLSSGKFGDNIILRGAQEVIERDGIIGAWWCSYPLEEWDQNFIFSLFDKQIIDRIVRPNLKYRFYRVDSPFSTNITIVTVEGEDLEGYCFSAGAACRETLKASWLKSILEAVQGKYFVRYLKGEIINGRGNREDIPLDFPDHAVYYTLFPEKLANTAFHNAQQNSRHCELLDIEDLNILAKKLTTKRPILFRDMTPTEVAKFTDWRVVKVVIPGLQPMHGNHKLPHLGGFLWAPRNLQDWYKTPPHPFA